MENSNRPEVGEYAARLAKLCDGPPKFYNLDVRETWQPRFGVQLAGGPRYGEMIQGVRPG
jgi:hypothetical protein